MERSTTNAGKVFFGPTGLVRVAYQATAVSISEYIPLHEDGFLGQFIDGRFTIELALKGRLFMVFSQDQDSEKTLHPIGQFAQGSQGRYFEHLVRIYQDRFARGVTKYPTNHLKCAWISNKEGSAVFQLWEIAIVAQRMRDYDTLTDFYLTVQLVAESKVYGDQTGNIFLPDFDGYARWESLQYYVKTLLYQSTLPDIGTYPVGVQEKSRQFEDHTGEVIWFNKANQFGLVRFGKHGQVARVHWSQISTPLPRTLESGQMVRFEYQVPAQQTAHRVTSVQWELKGVSVIE